MRPAFAALLVALSPLAAWPQNLQTVALDVKNMTCELCRITVRKSLEKVPGVSRIHVDFDKKMATVTYDADKTSAPALAQATSDAGFPSTVRK